MDIISSLISEYDAPQTPGTSNRNVLARYSPKRINEHTRWRFFRRHRALLLRRIDGVPSDRAALAIEQLIKAMWDAHVAEQNVSNATTPRDRSYALRVATDARKQILLWVRELNASTPKSPPVAPEPRLADLLAEDTKRRERGEMG